MQESIYIVDGARTPFLKAQGPGPFGAADLAVGCVRPLLARQQSIQPKDIDEVIAGCMIPGPDEANVGRIIGLRVGCDEKQPAWTVQRNCASGLQALDSAFQSIAFGRSQLVLAGGTEAMSRSPLLYSPKFTAWLAQWMGAKTLPARLQLLSRLRPGYFKPVIALLRGLTDPFCGLSMGQTTENIAHHFQITREEMDAVALQSHQRLAQAEDEGFLDEIVSIYDHQGHAYESDNGLRRDSSLERLAKLKPFFDRKYGRVTPANSSQVTDGAAFLLLASESAVKKYQLPTLARVVDIAWAGLAPEVMGLGPVHAIAPILERQKLALSDIDYWELNEAFAGQVLGCVKAAADPDYCREHLGLDKALGEIDPERLNIDGGAIACGHPVGATGARIVLHMANVLKRKDARYGIATLCIGGGQGGAMLLENQQGDA